MFNVHPKRSIRTWMWMKKIEKSRFVDFNRFVSIVCSIVFFLIFLRLFRWRFFFFPFYPFILSFRFALSLSKQKNKFQFNFPGDGELMQKAVKRVKIDAPYEQTTIFNKITKEKRQKNGKKSFFVLSQKCH